MGEIVLTILGIALFWWLASMAGSALKAIGRTLMGKGRLSDNFELEFKGMKPLDVKLRDYRLDGFDVDTIAKQIVGKGSFNIYRAKGVGFITSVFDKTSGEWEPVVSVLEDFRESNGPMYQHSITVGAVEPGQGYISWVPLGIVIPDLLQPPYGGSRQLVAVLRMIDLDNPPMIRHGYHQPDDPGILGQWALDFSYEFTDKGYIETAKDQEEAQALALKIGLVVAMSDGSIDDSEGAVLKNWIIRLIDNYSDDRKEGLKENYNQALKDTYYEIKKKEFSLRKVVDRLNDIGDIAVKYEAIELCFAVLAADGVADAKELDIVKRIAKALDLDFDEIEKMRDKTIMELDASVSFGVNVEQLLGIEKDWNNDKIKRHLRKEFQKWNDRLSTLSEGEERNNAQRMLDLIAEARNKYV
jgi:tellurite resistance protein